ncbi:hypothetical protein ACJMK2_025749, partial [Sinanodonta woodiana]
LNQMAFIILLIALVSVCSGEELISKTICSGESVILFRNVSLDINDTVAFLYKNGANKTLIAMWMSNNPKIAGSYTGKVFLDPEGNVWIRYINASDEAKYLLLHEIGGTARNHYEVNLTVLVAPTTNCKPAIKRVDNTLIASLQGTECGKPEASVQFEDYSYTSYQRPFILQNKALAILFPEQESRTYIACMQTPALRCNIFSNPFNFCAYFDFHNHPPINEEGLTGSTSTYVAVIVTLIFIIAVLVLIDKYCIRRGVLRTCNTNESKHDSQDLQQVPGNGEHEQRPMIPNAGNLQKQHTFDARLRISVVSSHMSTIHESMPSDQPRRGIQYNIP